MQQISSALSRLRAAADDVAGAFPKTRWTKLTGPGPNALELTGSGSFPGLALQPGKHLCLRCELKLPRAVAGVELAGQPLECTLASLYPAELEVDGRNLFAEEGVPVAAGPALFTVVPQLREGNNGTLKLRIRVPAHQTQRWFTLRFTTPTLRARFERLDVGWAQLALANALARTARERAAVLRAANLVPARGEIADALLVRLTEALAPLAERVGSHRVHLIGHSHIDMNWLWTWPDTVEVIRRDFRSVLKLMEDFPEFTFSHSQAVTYEVIRRAEPRLFAQVLQRIGEGRWESLAMQWTESDVNMPSGEGHARQLLEAVRYNRAHLGTVPTTFHAPDTFGHAGNLPQLIAAAGGRRYYCHRCNPGQTDQWPLFWWEGQDGTRILGVSTPGYNGGIKAREIAEAVLRAHRHGQAVALHFHGVGDHGGGPSRQNLEALRRFQNTPGLPQTFCSTIARFADEALAANPTLPIQRGEMQAIFEGCYTTHADVKRANRQGENLLTSADTLAALAGLDRRSELDNAWRKVLFHQFHDILDGSAIHEAYAMTRTDFAAVTRTARNVTQAALTLLQSGPAAGRIAVTNPLGFDREEWITVAGIKGKGAARLLDNHGQSALGQFTREGLGFVARVPAFGTVCYRVVAAGSDNVALPQSLRVSPAFSPNDPRQDNLLSDAPKDTPYFLVETPVFRVYVRRDSGIITSLVDKRSGHEFVSYGMRRAADYMDSARPDLALNVFQVTDEHDHRMTSWQLHELHTEHSLLQGATLRVIETGPARLVIEARHQIRRSAIRQHIIFYRDLARIDFRTWLDWQEPGNKTVGVPGLKVAFTTKLSGPRAWFETPLAAVERPADGQELVALRWADVSDQHHGIAVLNDSKSGYDALGSRLRLTLVRSAYDPDLIADLGRQEIRFSLVPHAGDWRKAGIVRAAASFNQPLLARVVTHQQKSRAVARPQVTGSSHIQVACLKRAHDGGGIIIRLYESAGKPGRVTLSGWRGQLWETNIVEERQQRVGKTLRFRPWQVRTFLVVS